MNVKLSASCRTNFRRSVAVIAAMTLPLVASASPYGGLAPGTPQLGPGIAPPSIVPGKEYSHDLDHMITPVGTALDTEQVVAWDGSGGVADGVDYTGERMNFTILSEVDAIANRRDLLFNNTLIDESHIIFSIDDEATIFTAGMGHAPFTVPSVGPITLDNTNAIGGAAEISYEYGTAGVSLGNPLNEQGLWAAWNQINDMPQPTNIDGLEVWGPEPAFTSDSDKYSLDTDSLSAALPGGAVSVWNSPSGTSYISHSEIVNAVQQVLGNLPTNIPISEVNLDALMVREVAGDGDDFGRDPMDPSLQDQIIFSIKQIPDVTNATGYYATGSELIVLNGVTGAATFLHHGGHDWDKTWALVNMKADILLGTTIFSNVQLDLNALEAITEGVIPEPASALLWVIGLAAFVGCRRRR